MNTTTFHDKPQASPQLRALYERLSAKNTAPLWEVLGEIVTPQPKAGCVPALWRYDDVRALLLEAGALISAQEAERRVLVLENPSLRGQSQVTPTLYAGVQLVMPGETAPTHRHSASALRFVLESGDGAYTAVDGERTTMHAGDFILTPSWTYHDHGNPGDQPAIWLDGLDIPLVNLFSASFAEHHPEEVQPVLRPEGDAMSRYGAGLMPVDFTPERRSPMLSYPYARSREALDRLQRNGPVDPVHGVKMQYVNPATGGYPMPTIAAFLQLLPRGFETRSYRSTDATIFCAAEGRGTSRVGDQRFTWGPRDVFVVPSWAPVSHDADEEAVLFSFSDRPAQKSLGLWREQRE
ncbi:MAG TPA: gentisate 1,2-dioxygenase [Vicinamibacterales bacterium]|nr:gentisate 1,2-dioxygenase [Vicinamibacterales bacterium]